MSKQLDDAQTLTKYLLGSLPAAETERLDELSVTDDEVAEALESVENDLIDAYVQDELDEAARAQFKTHYLASATRRERVAFAWAFQAQAEKSLTWQMTKAQAEIPTAARTQAATKVAPGRKGWSIFSALRGFNISRPAWGAAFAALVLLAVGVWLAFDNARLRQRLAQTEARRLALEQQAQESQKELTSQRAASAQLADERAEHERLAQEQTQRDQQRIAEQQRLTEQRAANQQSSSSSAGSIASFILAPQMRGASQIQTISIPTRTDHVVMRLQLEPNEFKTYRVTLFDETGSRILWRSSQLKARAAIGGKLLSVNLSARLFNQQIAYLLRVTNDAGEIVDDYPLRVVR